jgi:hypothetical protein
VEKRRCLDFSALVDWFYAQQSLKKHDKYQKPRTNNVAKKKARGHVQACSINYEYLILGSV